VSESFGPDNPNWKGGRTVASNGYVLVKDRDNPMADVRGYVYEHRLVVSEREGRPLTTREQVHHDDLVKTNNDDDNLELCASLADHRVRHRRRTDLRMPSEPNVRIECACGCGQQFDRYDGDGRPRRFVSGHNPQPSPTCGAILALLKHGPLSRRVLIARMALTEHAVAVALSKLKRAGRVEQAALGVWRLREKAV
jgi:predicted Rossmann fold nucleotide-binding protein DprA/Smf involved in DNA uptake